MAEKSRQLRAMLFADIVGYSSLVAGDEEVALDIIGDYIELPHTEMYGERFDIPTPDELIFVSWFAGGEVFRSGCVFNRGHGKIFYFRPGHETYPTYYDENVRTVLRNAVRWAHNPAPRVADVDAAPNVPVEQALEPFTARGPKLHADGEEGFR